MPAPDIIPIRCSGKPASITSTNQAPANRMVVPDWAAASAARRSRRSRATLHRSPANRDRAVVQDRIQASGTAKAGFRNSHGWKLRPRFSQRRAPFTSVPMIGTRTSPINISAGQHDGTAPRQARAAASMCPASRPGRGIASADAARRNADRQQRRLGRQALRAGGRGGEHGQACQSPSAPAPGRAARGRSRATRCAPRGGGPAAMRRRRLVGSPGREVGDGAAVIGQLRAGSAGSSGSPWHPISRREGAKRSPRIS